MSAKAALAEPERFATAPAPLLEDLHAPSGVERGLDIDSDSWHPTGLLGCPVGWPESAAGELPSPPRPPTRNFS